MHFWIYLGLSCVTCEWTWVKGCIPMNMTLCLHIYIKEHASEYFAFGWGYIFPYLFYVFLKTFYCQYWLPVSHLSFCHLGYSPSPRWNKWYHICLLVQKSQTEGHSAQSGIRMQYWWQPHPQEQRMKLEVYLMPQQEIYS